METGLRVSELRALRLGDVDREQGGLRVRSGSQERWIALGPNGRHYLLSYLEQYRSKEQDSAGESTRERPEEGYLFLSERYQPLTSNAITLLFGRLKTRAGITEKRVCPSALRDTFAVRYLQSGGKLETLCEILGLVRRGGGQTLSALD
jgi:Site-specific recombinase XerD